MHFSPRLPPSSIFWLEDLMSTKSFALNGITAAILTATTISASNIALADAEKMETVYISATRSEGPQMPVATQITIIDSEQIRISGATTISEVLRSQAGVQISDADGSGSRNVTASIHGLSGANNVLVLVDGRKLNNPTLASPALNTVALKNIERIEIIQGSAGVLYGDQAVGGVINVITHHAKQGEIDGAVSVEAGSDNLENYTASVRQGFENGLSYSLSAQKRNADNYRQNNQTATTNVLGNIGYSFANGKVFIEQQKIEDDLNLAGSLFDFDAEVNRRQTKTPNNYSNQNTDLTRVGGEVDVNDNWKLLGEYADRDENGIYFGDDYYNDPSSPFYFPYTSEYNMRVKNITPRVVGNIGTSNGNAILTLGYDGVDADYSTKDDFTKINQQIDGYYAQIIYPFTQKLSATAGARYSTADDTNYRAYDENFNSVTKTHKSSKTASELGLNYQIDSAWRVFARSADGFRFANTDENGFTLPEVTFLKTQTSKSQEVGVAWSEKVAEVKYSVYHMKLNNELRYDPVIANANSYNGQGANINLPQSERRGFIFDGNVQLSDEIGLRANYTYTDSELTSGSFNGKQVPYVAKNTGNVGIVFNFIKNVTASFEANYTGSRYGSGDDANAYAKVDSLNLFNFNILWDIQAFELGFRIKNITAEKYADLNGISSLGQAYQYPQPERAYNAHISYRF
ncbi:MAG: TonB-dependent receptor [Moraxellaceae bacterium]|nr:MAG: TonB-dependent receptor [Moraxellaceae bacterium]